MATPERIQLSQVETQLLCISASELIPILKKEEKHVLSTKQCAFEYYDDDSKQIYQVQVIVTRSESDFIPAFTTETMEQLQQKG